MLNMYCTLPLYICIYLRATREISIVLIVLPSINKVFIIIIIIIKAILLEITKKENLNKEPDSRKSI